MKYENTLRILIQSAIVVVYVIMAITVMFATVWFFWIIGG
jgi:hypothetical protein